MSRALVIALFLAACGNSSPTVDATPVDVAADAPGFGACTGPDNAPTEATLVTDGTSTIAYQGFEWGENNDCPAAGAPAGVISVTLTGTQVGNPSGGLGFCLPRPDLIGTGAIFLADVNSIQIVGAGGTADGCTYSLVSADANPSGTITFGGFCTQKGSSYSFTPRWRARPPQRPAAMPAWPTRS